MKHHYDFMEIRDRKGNSRTDQERANNEKETRDSL